MQQGKSMEAQKCFKAQYVPGIYPMDADLEISDFPEAAAQENFALIRLKGQEISNKQTFITHFAAAAQFPDYAQANWDSFEECVRDLEWYPAEGYVVLYDHYDLFQQNSPEEWQIALDILAAAVDFWKTTPTPMFVFLKSNG